MTGSCSVQCEFMVIDVDLVCSAVMTRMQAMRDPNTSPASSLKDRGQINLRLSLLRSRFCCSSIKRVLLHTFQNQRTERHGNRTSSYRNAFKEGVESNQLKSSVSSVSFRGIEEKRSSRKDEDSSLCFFCQTVWERLLRGLDSVNIQSQIK